MSLKSEVEAVKRALGLDKKPNCPPPPAIRVLFIEPGTTAVVNEFMIYPPGSAGEDGTSR